MQAFITRLIELGKRQLNARCNNRLSEQHRIRVSAWVCDVALRERRAPDEEVALRELGESALPHESESVLGLIDHIRLFDPDDTSFDSQIQQWRRDLDAEAEDIRRSIAGDRARGDYRDYTRLRRLIAQTIKTNNDVGTITLELPYFLSLALTKCRATEQDTRRKQQQAVLARSIDYTGSLAAAEASRMGHNAGGQQRRRRSQRQRSDYDD